LKIKWADAALRDLRAIRDYIALDNPVAADRVAEKITDAADSLKTMPNRGRRGRSKAVRELVLAPLPYILAYRVKESEVHIVRVWHGRQRR
jgi:addiction module RelE/StbE family toxin